MSDELARVIDEAGSFSLGGVGFVGRPSPAELAARQLATQPGARDAAVALVERGSPVGRLYGFWLLGQLAPDDAARYAPRLTADQTPVHDMKGCSLGATTVAAVARSLAAEPAAHPLRTR